MFNLYIEVYLINGYNKQNQPQNSHIIVIDKPQMLSMKLAYNSVNTNYELDLCKFAICEEFYLSPNSH